MTAIPKLATAAAQLVRSNRLTGRPRGVPACGKTPRHPAKLVALARPSVPS
jgi:hypothetical protein